MRKSFSRVLSIILTVAMMITLLPATFVSAANAPVFTLSIVNSEGEAVEELYPGISAYLRVGVTGIEEFHNLAVNVTATNARFGTDVKGLVKRYEDYSVFTGKREISLINGVELSETSAKIKFTKVLDDTVPNEAIQFSRFTLVDIPFTISDDIELGTEVSFEFLAGDNETNIYIGGVAAFNRYTIGHPTRPVIAMSQAADVEEAPYKIVNVALKTALGVIPLGVDFPGFGEGNRIVATYDRDKDGDNIPDTHEYEIITKILEEDAASFATTIYTKDLGTNNIYTDPLFTYSSHTEILGDTPPDGKAYINIQPFNKDAMGTYTFDVIVSDSTVLNSPYTQEDAVSVTVGNPVTTGNITADTTKVVEVKYGADADAVKAAISARTDLFKDILTDGSQAAATYTVDAANIDTTGYVSTSIDTEQTVKVTAVSGKTVVDGTVKVKVIPTTITSIALNPAWVNQPEMPDGTPFPGFGGRSIVATFDSATSAIASATFEIVTDGAASEKAYIDVTSYKADTAGTYKLPVVIKSSALGNSQYEGTITLTVDPAESTGNITADTTKVVEVKYGADADAVKAAISARTDLFKDILTDGSQAAATYTVDAANIDTTGYVSTSVGTEQTVTVTAVSGKTVVDGTVKVKVKPTTITGIALNPAWVNQPEMPDGTPFPGFGGRSIVATFDSATSAIASGTFEIVTDGAASEKAYIDVTSYKADTAGAYTLPVVIKSSALSSSQYEGTITLTVDTAGSTGTITADTTKVVEVKYGADADAVKAAISARTDLFKDILTDGTQVDAVYTVDVANIDTTGYVSTSVGTEQTVTVTAVADKTVADGTVKVKVNPTTITGIALDPPWISYPEAADGTPFPGFGGRSIVATFDSATSAIASGTFEIVTDGAASEKAYIDVTSYKADTAGAYTLPVVIKSSALSSSQYEGTITLTVDTAGSTGTITADTTKVVEVKYGADADAVKAAISARTDLFKDILTDGTQVDAVYTVDVANIDTTGYVSTSVGTEQIVRVTAVADKTVVDGTVKVKVKPTTIIGIALDSAWVNHPEMPDETPFPGFGNRKIVATFDSATSAIESATFEIVTEEQSAEKAYIDISSYDAATKGAYTLPVVVTTAAIGSGSYSGFITLTVDPAVATDDIRLVRSFLVIDNPVGSEADVATAEALVMSTPEMFATVLTNGELGAFAEGVFATSVTSEYSAAEKVIYVTITSVSGGKTLIDENVVTVSVDAPPVIKGSVKVFDITGEVNRFTNAIPTGAVITAVKLTDEQSGGNFVSPSFISYATGTDVYGNFELVVEPGTYKVYVAHDKYEFVEGEFYVSRTISGEYDITIEDGGEENLGEIDITYTFFGDIDFDGDVDTDDYAKFAANFGSSIN